MPLGLSRRTGFAATVAALALPLVACGARAPAGVAGDAAAGQVAVTRMACGSCHVIPGAEEADGRVGPPLTGFAKRQMIAGVLANSPANLERYLRAPDAVVPGNVMPDQHLSDKQLRDITAYLFTLN